MSLVDVTSLVVACALERLGGIRALHLITSLEGREEATGVTSLTDNG